MLFPAVLPELHFPYVEEWESKGSFCQSVPPTGSLTLSFLGIQINFPGNDWKTSPLLEVFSRSDTQKVMGLLGRETWLSMGRERGCTKHLTCLSNEWCFGNLGHSALQRLLKKLLYDWFCFYFYFFLLLFQFSSASPMKSKGFLGAVVGSWLFRWQFLAVLGGSVGT